MGLKHAALIPLNSLPWSQNRLKGLQVSGGCTFHCCHDYVEKEMPSQPRGQGRKSRKGGLSPALRVHSTWGRASVSTAGGKRWLPSSETDAEGLC